MQPHEFISISRLLLVFLITIYSCSNTKKTSNKDIITSPKDTSILIDRVFIDNLSLFEESDEEIHPLEVAIKKANKLKKPLFLWFTFLNSNDVTFWQFSLEKDSSILNLLDRHFVCCRIWCNSKLPMSKIENANLKTLFPKDIYFKTEGRFNEWLADNYFKYQVPFFVITDSKLNKLSEITCSIYLTCDLVKFRSFIEEYLEQEKAKQ